MTSALPMPEFRERFGDIADTSALVPLINIAFMAEQMAIDGDRVNAEKLQSYFKTGRFLVVENDQGLSGCVYVELRGVRGYIGLLALRPEFKGRGLGRRLMTSAEAYLASAGCEAADLRTISARNDLLPMYKHLGYSEIGTEHMPQEIRLKVPCHFIVLSKQLPKPSGTLQNP